VEEAFYCTNRVMTLSFHKYGEYFPGTGDIKDIGANAGRYYALNFPLKDHIDDDSYQRIFQPVVQHVMDWYNPGAVVLQCGADSLAGDRLGCFNLSLKGHAACVDFLKSFHKPLLLLGGGGYTIRNVARCWTYETSRALDTEVDDELPFNDYFEYFGPDFRLHITPSNQDNQNSREYLEKCTKQLIENLRHIEGAPSVQLHDLPETRHAENDDEDKEDPDNRRPQRLIDQKIAHNEELSESEDEDGRRDNQSFKPKKHSKTTKDLGQGGAVAAAGEAAVAGTAGEEVVAASTAPAPTTSAPTETVATDGEAMQVDAPAPTTIAAPTEATAAAPAAMDTTTE